MLGRGVAQALRGDWEAAFAQVRPWPAEADLAFANLESPLTTAPQLADGYDLRAPPEAVAALCAAGFDVVSLANNHALDAGAAGLAETMSTLHAAGIKGVLDRGAARNDDFPNAARAATMSLPRYQLLAFDDSAVPLDVEAAGQQVAAAAGQGGLVIASIHWGGEYQAAPSLRQQDIAVALSKAGAGLIIGHGPHVLQRVEWVEGTLVAYSLGNFLFDQSYPVDCRWGVILRVRVQDNRIVAIEPLPTIIEHGQVRLASPQESSDILARLHLASR